MELQARALQESDWETLVNWWNSWEEWGVYPSQEMLPLNGTGGLMIEDNGIPIVAGFLYLTNSKIAWLEWIISDKKYTKPNKKEAIELLIKSLEDVAKSTGAGMIFSVAKNKSLLKIHGGLGYAIDETPSYEISKKI
jgi:hypothetical protein